MLELKGVDKRIGNEVHLVDIDLALEPGSLNVLLGPTLAGKTSLMRMMAGLDRPTAGAIFMDGADVTGVPVQKRDVAMVYQQFINYPAMTVRANIASPMKIAGKSKAEIAATIERVSALLQLDPYLDRLPLQLSGGQQQRCALARALAKNARLVLLDEPLANLDYKLREELRAELPKIFAESGAIFVYATAEPEEALLLGGNTATLKEGRITQFGPTVDVYRRPNTLATARTFSDPPLNAVPMTKTGNTFRHTSGHETPVPAALSALGDGDYNLGVRPHHVAPVEGGSDADAITLPATARITEITGSESYVHITCLGEPFVLLAHGIRIYDRGTQFTIGFNPRHLLLFDADGTAITPTGERMAA
ncbi:ABC transporter ATP-binding protein [Acuticoccus sp. MNP-M23]|uniref:ABC transporter ATP-binding protein n=1 Tax=Acuticoccus sp. MNP-M23 TaxID=3072793 RepID=UPI002814EBCD|nr:ABC transporter ATP-binding protein [Acuticoccus sp. MNP-M23]WMS42369.1 ABC transporter ATP-binding protein [Acuticoccus sp. MNP-M23]